MIVLSLTFAGLLSLLPLVTLTSHGGSVRRLVKIVARLFEQLVTFAFGVSAIAGLFIALVQLSTLILRNIFAVNFIWLQESAIYLFGTMFLLSSGSVLLLDGHVRVDVFYSRASERMKALIDLSGLYLFVLPVCGLVIYAAAPYVAQSWAAFERSPEESGIHAVYLLKSLIPAFGIILAMAAFVRIERLCAQLGKAGKP
ncbi:MAG: TRAP transporter small permease subunit [Pseudomonadota bacterium]